MTSIGVVSKVLEFKQGKTEAPARSAGEMPLVWGGTPAGLLLTFTPIRITPRSCGSLALVRAATSRVTRCFPIHMVDEPIYKRLPSFLIATVDKFAAMPWKGEVAKLFGRVKSYKRGVGFLGDCDVETGIEMESYLPPPELIIQDELHLISGPLGTIAGLYETAIDHLCRDRPGPGPQDRLVHGHGSPCRPIRSAPCSGEARCRSSRRPGRTAATRSSP